MLGSARSPPAGASVSAATPVDCRAPGTTLARVRAVKIGQDSFTSPLVSTRKRTCTVASMPRPAPFVVSSVSTNDTGCPRPMSKIIECTALPISVMPSSYVTGSSTSNASAPGISVGATIVGRTDPRVTNSTESSNSVSSYAELPTQRPVSPATSPPVSPFRSNHVGDAGDEFGDLDLQVVRHRRQARRRPENPAERIERRKRRHPAHGTGPRRARTSARDPCGCGRRRSRRSPSSATIVPRKIPSISVGSTEAKSTSGNS